ncbi:hypothetical protein LguiB_027430 [Lonicera macranthoides]
MDDATLSGICVPKNILQPLFNASNSSTLEESLTRLIETARGTDGRSDLASKNILTTVLQLCQSLSCPSSHHLVLLSLKLLRNLCAGEIINQNTFIEQDGVGLVANVLSSIAIASDSNSSSNYGIVRMSLQLLGNVSLAGEEHRRAVWHRFFPLEFIDISRLRSREICDPLSMVIYTCSEGNNRLFAQMCSDQGLAILTEIIKTATAAGFEEDWLKLLLSRICLEESRFAPLFSTLCPMGVSGDSDDVKPRVDLFVPEQAFLLSIVSEILNERIGDITISSDFASNVLRILRSAIVIVDSVTREQSGLPTGSSDIDVLGYSLTILRDLCATDGLKQEGSVDIVDSLVSSGLLELLLNILNDLEPPSIIRKALKQGENREGTTSNARNLCPYKGFRRDIVAIIGNCAYRRKHVQDLIRQKNGILIMLQHCVTDEDNPFLREWGIWSARNLLEGNVENQRVVSELELQGSVDVPELTGLGLRVEVDQKTRRAKLVNVS